MTISKLTKSRKYSAELDMHNLQLKQKNTEPQFNQEINCTCTESDKFDCTIFKCPTVCIGNKEKRNVISSGLRSAMFSNGLEISFNRGGSSFPSKSNAVVRVVVKSVRSRSDPALSVQVHLVHKLRWGLALSCMSCSSAQWCPRKENKGGRNQ